METTTYTSTHTATPMTTPAGTGQAPLAGPRKALDAARSATVLYGALSATALVAVAAVAACGQTVNTFMWVRAGLLPVVAFVLHRLAVAAAGDSRRAFERLRAVSAVMPVAIVGVDLIPGVCPLWYAAAQALCVLPVVRIAFLTRGPALRAAFPPASPAR